eukprot:449645-Rhodomonas_salina.2
MKIEPGKGREGGHNLSGKSAHDTMPTKMAQMKKGRMGGKVSSPGTLVSLSLAPDMQSVVLMRGDPSQGRACRGRQSRSRCSMKVKAKARPRHPGHLRRPPHRHPSFR